MADEEMSDKILGLSAWVTEDTRNTPREDSMAGRLPDGFQNAKYEEPPKVTSVEQHLLCAPPQVTGIQHVKDNTGFTQLKTKQAFQALRLVTDSYYLSLRAGDDVYVTSEVIMNSQWSKMTFDMEGKQVVIVPTDKVIAFKRN